MSTVAESSTITRADSTNGPDSIGTPPAPVRPSQPPAPPSEDRPYAISADMFLAMIEAGVFPEDARVYLQDGRIFEKMAKTRPHSAHGVLINAALVSHSRPDWLVFPEGEFLMDEWNAKLPDFAVVRSQDRRAFLASKEPLKARDLTLAVEIAVTSLAKDLGENFERYARAMIPNYWVADVTGRRLLAHSEPRLVDSRGVYSKVDIILPGGSVELLLDGQDPVRFAYEDLML